LTRNPAKTPRKIRSSKVGEGKHMRHLTRRELLKAGVAATVLAGGARAATSPVYPIRATNREEGIRRGMAVLGLAAARGKRVVIR